MNKHEQILMRYINALENGDLAVLTEIWQLAEKDSRLTQDLLELNQEMGVAPMSHSASSNGHVKSMSINQHLFTHTQRTTAVEGSGLHLPTVQVKQYTTVFRRVAVLAILVLGALGMMFAFLPKHDPVQTVPIFGTTPTAVPPEDLEPITPDNADQLVEINRNGTGNVRGALWSPDGSQIVVYGTYIWVYDAQDLTAPLKTIDVNLYADFAAFGSDPNSLIVANEHGQAYDVNLSDETSSELPSLDNTLAFARFDNWVARAEVGAGAKISVWDLEKKREVFVFYDLNKWVYQLAFSPDGSILAAAGSSLVSSFSTASDELPTDDYQVMLWDMQTGEQTMSLDIDYGTVTVTNLAFSVNGSYITASVLGWGAQIYQWNIEKNRSSQPSAVTGISSLLLAYTTDTLYGIDSFGPIVALDTETLDVIHQLNFDYTDAVELGMYFGSADVNLATQELLLATPISVHVIDLQSGEQTASIETFSSFPGYNQVDATASYILFHNKTEVVVQSSKTHEIIAQWHDENRSITEAVFLSDDTVIVYGKPNTQSKEGVILWNFLTNEHQGLTGDDISKIARPRAVEVSPNGEQVGYLVPSGELYVQDVETNMLTGYNFDKNFADLDGVLAYHPDGQILAVTGWSRNIEIFDTSQPFDNNSTAQIATLAEHSTTVTDIAFSQDGQWLFSIDANGNVIIWSTMTWEDVNYTQLTSDYFNRIAVSLDSSLVAVASDSKIYFLDATTLEVVNSYTAHAGAITDLVFTPDGTQLISASQDGTVRYWGVPQE